MKNFLILLTLSYSFSSLAAALVKKNVDTKTLTVIARMVYSGGALTEELARTSTDEIHKMWNESPTEVMLGEELYKVEFEVDYILGGGVLAEADSCAYNYIQILNPRRSGDRSFYNSLGARGGVFFTSDDLGNSTTAAHEFGHGLTLDHNPINQVLAPVPGIMFARGTLVKPEFQWNINVPTGSYGGTVNPVHRHVRSEDILAIPFAKVLFNEENIGCIGHGKPMQIL